MREVQDCCICKGEWWVVLLNLMLNSLTSKPLFLSVSDRFSQSQVCLGCSTFMLGRIFGVQTNGFDRHSPSPVGNSYLLWRTHLQAFLESKLKGMLNQVQYFSLCIWDLRLRELRVMCFQVKPCSALLLCHTAASCSQWMFIKFLMMWEAVMPGVESIRNIKWVIHGLSFLVGPSLKSKLCKQTLDSMWGIQRHQQCAQGTWNLMTISSWKFIFFDLFSNLETENCVHV